jgi:hypothetical protein
MTIRTGTGLNLCSKDGFDPGNRVLAVCVIFHAHRGSAPPVFVGLASSGNFIRFISRTNATPSLVNWNWGLTAGPVPPIVGCAWYELRPFELNRAETVIGAARDCPQFIPQLILK